jgi:uncharacterized delta-60 repeat protein
MLTAALVAGVISALSLPAGAAPGDRDPISAGFGANGAVYPAGFVNVLDIAVQPDGKVVSVGYTRTADELAVARYLPDGQPDNTFDRDGTATFRNMFSAVSVALQKNGRIVVGGSQDDEYHLARLTPDGALDTSFGADGWLQDTDINLYHLAAVLLQADGQIVACGRAYVGTQTGFGVTRYNADGSRDSSFGGDGSVTIPFGASSQCHDIAQQRDGALVAAGVRISGRAEFAVARLNPNGTLDTGFGSDGKLTTGFDDNEYGQAVALQPDGKIVVLGIGFKPYSSYAARYLPDGALDTTFGTGGKLTISADSLAELAVQPDGKLVALGYHISPEDDARFAVRRLLPDGAPDTSFAGDGVAWLDFGGDDRGRALALLPDGRILAGGIAHSASGVLAGLRPDGSFDIRGR